MTESVRNNGRSARYHVVDMLPKSGIGAEIGVWKGEFSSQLLQGANPQRLYLIDPWQTQNDSIHRKAWYGVDRGENMEEIYQGVMKQFASERAEGTVVVRRGASQDVLREFPDGHFDFIYIDGDHEYSAVRQDCFLAFEKVRVGGLICGDDYAIRGWWKDGVVRAFHELIAQKTVLIRHVRGTQIVLEKL